jgi:integrase
VKPISDNTLEILNTLDTEGIHDFLFISPKSGKRFTTIQKVFNRLKAEAGIPKFRIHDCRHQYASRLANAGVSLHTIKELLNHSDQKTTERYMHTSMQTLQVASNTAALNIKGALQGIKPVPQVPPQ